MILLEGGEGLWSDVGMQTLGLASESKPTDGMFKRLFWPTIENQYDVDLVGQQGFWVCLLVAGMSLLTAVFAGLSAGPIAFAVTLFFGFCAALTYFLAGVGVRERSIGAAVLIFLCYLTDRIASFEISGTPILGFPLIGVVALMLLLANVRATILSLKWRESGEAGDQPDSMEVAAEGWPAKVWPWGRFVFYPMASLVLLLSVASIVALPIMQKRRAEQLKKQQQEDTFTVQPADR